MADGVGDFEFCLDCKHLLLSVDSANGGVILEVATRAGVHIRTPDPDTPRCVEKATLSTYVDGNQSMDLERMEFSVGLEFDVTRMRDLLKRARSVKAERLRLRVCTTPPRAGDGGFGHSEVTLTIQTESYSYSQTFSHPVEALEGGSMPWCRAVGDGDEEGHDTIMQCDGECDGAGGTRVITSSPSRRSTPLCATRRCA